MPQVTLRTRMPGTPGDALPDLLIDLASERLTVRELIRRAVEEQLREVTAGRLRPGAVARPYLTDAEIREMAAGGAVRLPAARAGDEAGDGGPPDPAAEVDRALRAFRRGTFAILVGGRQAGSLDEQITVRLGEPVVFLRLTPLAGG